jgi:hypothetical protein
MYVIQMVIGLTECGSASHSKSTSLPSSSVSKPLRGPVHLSELLKKFHIRVKRTEMATSITFETAATFLGNTCHAGDPFAYPNCPAFVPQEYVSSDVQQTLAVLHAAIPTTTSFRIGPSTLLGDAWTWLSVTSAVDDLPLSGDFPGVSIASMTYPSW